VVTKWSFSNSTVGQEKKEWLWMGTWKEYGSKRLWHIRRYYPNIFLDGLRKSTKVPSEDSLLPEISTQLSGRN
jgi:hypothetical protein